MSHERPNERNERALLDYKKHELHMCFILRLLKNEMDTIIGPISEISEMRIPPTKKKI